MTRWQGGKTADDKTARQRQNAKLTKRKEAFAQARATDTVMSFFKKLFGLDDVSPHGPQDALLVTVDSREELIALESLLRSAGIPYECRARGAGGPLNVIAGYSVYSTDIFVRADMLEMAQELIAPIGDTPDGEDASGDESGTPEVDSGSDSGSDSAPEDKEEQQ